MLKAIAPDIWHVQHNFKANGLPVSSRMTIVRLGNGGLWLHSPVLLSSDDRAQIEALGKVQYIVAPSKTHHLFVSDCIAHFPNAKLFGAPGLSAKRPDLVYMTELVPAMQREWSSELEEVFFDGIPFGNETVWFHKSSKTLIVTDLCQWWQGDLPFAVKAYAYLTGVRKYLAVPRTIRMIVKNRPAAQASAQKILQWPFERVIVAHNAIVEENAYAAVKQAFTCF
jgi:hypothetical protein